MVFLSSRSLKTREKFVSIFFDDRAIYVFFYKIKSFVKLNIDGSALKKYANWDKPSCLILYIFLLFWGIERRQKPNIPHLRQPIEKMEIQDDVCKSWDCPTPILHYCLRCLSHVLLITKNSIYMYLIIIYILWVLPTLYHKYITGRREKDRRMDKLNFIFCVMLANIAF